LYDWLAVVVPVVLYELVAVNVPVAVPFTT
jgi:hypothetical protein